MSPKLPTYIGKLNEYYYSETTKSPEYGNGKVKHRQIRIIDKFEMIVNNMLCDMN